MREICNKNKSNYNSDDWWNEENEKEQLNTYMNS